MSIENGRRFDSPKAPDSTKSLVTRRKDQGLAASLSRSRDTGSVFEKPAVQKEQTPKGKSTWGRRAGVAVALTGIVTSGLAETAFIAEANSGAITRALAIEPKDIPSEVPPQLQGKDIPTTNEHYQAPFAVVQAGLDAYIKDGGTPFYKRPDYYLTQGEALATVITGGKEALTTEDKPYAAALSFYRGAYFDPVDLYDNDPGTSSQKDIENKLASVPLSARTTTNQFRQKEYTAPSQAIINKTYAEHFAQTKHDIDQIRNGEKASPSVLFTYYLEKNDGDIVQSLLDTTLFVRFVARGDTKGMLSPETFKKATVSEYSGRGNAELLSSMFYDDASQSVPLDWLLQNVSPEDKELNVDDSRDNTQWKDYMPVNRAGTEYHRWSIIGMAAIMDPVLDRAVVTFDELNTSWPEHGKIKIKADETALEQVGEIRDIFDKYKRE